MSCDRLRDRTRAQPGRLRALGADVARCRMARRQPQRQLHPRLHAGLLELVLGDPAQGRVAAGRRTAARSSSPIVVWPRGPVPLKAPARARLGQVHQPCGEVARVDDLQRPRRVARRGHRRRPRRSAAPTRAAGRRCRAGRRSARRARPAPSGQDVRAPRRPCPARSPRPRSTSASPRRPACPASRGRRCRRRRRRSGRRRARRCGDLLRVVAGGVDRGVPRAAPQRRRGRRGRR